MCPPDSTHQAHSSMTESSRTRSDSLEASSSQQERKRPRLDSGPADGLRSDEALTDSGLPGNSPDSYSLTSVPTDGPCPTTSLSPSSLNMATSSNGPLSKVTINTRSAANTANHANEATTNSGDRPENRSTPQNSPVIASATPLSSADEPEMVAVPQNTIAIHSSPSQSPEIQIAIVEDIDQDPADTNWTPVTRLADSARLQDQATPHYVSRTFPYAQRTPAGFTHDILTQISKTFVQGGENDGILFIEFKDWLITFLEHHPQVSQRLVHEERAFWEELPEAVHNLLRRLIDVPAEARTSDLEDFFVAYGQLAIRFIDLDIHLMDQCQASGSFDKLSELHCRYYLPTLTMVLQYREIPFYNLLHENRGFNAFDLVSTVCDRLSSSQSGILPTLTKFVDRLGYVLPRKPALTMVFVQALAVGNTLARSGIERMLLQATERAAPSPAIQRINHQVLDLCMKADDLLQSAISKQSPWLTIENSPDILRFLTRMLISISEQDAHIAEQLVTYVSDQYPETGPRELPEIIGYAWKFKTLRKYITAGRMELRVYGMDSMQTDLVQVWKCYAQYNPNSLSVPLVRFLVQSLRDNKMVQYIVGVDSHPQLITRSNNVVGFLVVTGTYCDEDSDIIWRTVKESQDPRTVSEVLTMLKSIFNMQGLPTLMHLCHKLLELPVERYDGRMNDYADAMFARIRELALSRPQQDEYLEAVPFEVCVRLIRDVIASKTCSQQQQRHLPSWAAEHLVRLLAFNINIEDKRRLWEQCVQDIAQKTRFATGSMRALQAWLEEHPDLEVPKLAHDFDFARLLIEELVDCLNRNQAETSISTFLQILLPTRLCLLALIAQYAPDTLTEELTEQLWFNVLASPAFDGCLSDMAWDIFSKVVTRCRKQNSMIQRLMMDYLPRLNAEDLNERLLHFAENSVLYELQLEQPRDHEDRDVVSLPGINRVWRFVMECPMESVVNEATNWIIKQYLDHEVVLRCPRQVVESTHISLMDRCLSEVFSAASKLKSLHEGTGSGDDEKIVAGAPEGAASAEVLRFTRSLLFLRQFLSGVKCRPRYSPTLSTELRLPEKPFQSRGEEVTIKYEVGAIPGRSTSSLQRKLVIGDQNTVDELARYISDLTGFTQFTAVARGQIISLSDNQTTIKDSNVGSGLLLVQKVPDTPEKQPISVPPAASSMDAHVMDHFDEFYGLLDLDDRLSKEVHAFLELFPPQPRIIELIRTKRAAVFDLLPTGKPYKLLYGLNALRGCVEQEALGSSPDEDFMLFSVSSIISVLNRTEAIETDKARGLLVNHVLIDCLQLAMRAPVSPATFQAYFSNSAGLADRLVSLSFEAAESEDVQRISIPVNVLVRQPFSVLMESALHDPQIRAEVASNNRVHALIERTLLVDKRLEVRRAVADVLFGLTGQPVIKLVFQKTSDLGSARSRLSADKIEGFLAILWKSLAEILPKSYLHPSTSQQLIDVSLAILRVIGKSMEPAEVIACFQKWSSLLVSYDHQEIVGKIKDDFVVWGFTNLLQEAFRLVQTLQLDVATSEIAQSVFDTFLFPNPTSEAASKSDQRIPLLKASTREDLYTLVLSFTRDKAGYDSILGKLDGLVVKETFPGFAPHIQSERQALRSDVGYAGLRNLSNTCYLNSLFSQLFMNLRFRDFIFAMDGARTGSSRQPLVHELSKLFASMQNRWDKYVDTTEVVARVETYDNEQIDVSIQMDVDEFFNLLFDRLEGQISNPSDRNTFRSLYGGQLVQQIKSRECDHISERLEPFSAIQCEIKGKLTLEDSLQAYVEGEVMQGDNKYSCTSCNRHVDAIKRACLKDIPDHLIFNLKRFDFDITTMTRCKVNDEFRFPLSIDMAPYNVESLSNPEDAIPPDMFELVGVLVHSGTAESGHYYSYIRERPTPRPACDSWVQFNDIDVSVFDSQRISDCCYGGVELTSTLHLSKSHNAYMLFYQRVSSIKRFEAVYGKHDPANPVRLPFSPTIMAEIGVQNQSTIRSYCLQDPSHARFMRLMLERMQGSPNRQCSSDHITEGKMIRHSLDYIQQISCRFKEMPEFETCCKLLQDCGQQCYDCASHIASFFASTDFMDVEVRKESVLRSAILRNPAQLVRRSFASMLCEALRTMRKGINEADLDPQLGTAREAEYRHTFTSCIGNLAEPWVDMHKFGRAWNDYFDLLSRLTNLGIWEVGIVLQHGFLEKLGQVIWADVRHDPMDLRARYASYVNLREKGRLFGLTGLIALLSSLLESVHFHVGCEADQPRSPNRDGFYELSTYEMQLLRPSKLGPKQKPAFEWLRKIIVSRQNPNAVTKIISTLLQEPMLALPLEITLAAGLSSEAVGEATAFLDPAIAFCTFCKNPALVQLLVRDALGQIDSIGGTFGKEHLDFVIELSDVENEAASLSKRDFSTMVFKSLKSWAPTLLLYPDDIHYDIRGDTVRFLRERLFDPLQNADLNPDQEDALRRHVRALAKACILHIQQNHIPRAGKQITAIEMGQAHQITRVIHHICHGYFTNGDAADDHFVAEATATLERLQTLTQEAAEAASEDWADNDSVAASDSDNPDSQEWAEPT